MAKNVRKKNSILNFVAVALVTIIGIVLSVCSFDIPFTHYHYEGFANSISLGLDLAGGVSIVYECSVDDGKDLDSAIEATVARLESVIGEEYSEVTVTRQGSDKIRIEVPSVTNADEIFDLIGTPTPLYMTAEEGSDATVYVSGDDISDVSVGYNSSDSVYGVQISFTSDGAKNFQSLISVASDNDEIYVYIGELGNDDDLMTISGVSEITSYSSIFITNSSDSTSWTYDEAKEVALRIMSGTFSANLSLYDKSVVSATLGTEALKYVLIGGFIGLFLVFVIMWLRYGDLGFLAAFAMVIYIVLMLFFLQAISFVQLTLPGLAGIVLSIGMAVDGAVIIFERMREEYASGKKLHLAYKNAFKRAFWPIFDSNITTIITAVVLYILGTASIQGFAITLLIGIVLSMFMNLVVLRFFVKWYIPFNPVKGEKLHFPKPKRKAAQSDVEADEPSSTEIVVENGDVGGAR